MKEYKNRIADTLLRYRLEEMGAVLVEGLKWCGKTTTCEQQAKSVIYMDDPQMKRQYREMANTQVSSLLDGDTPHLIDEWQVAPQLWDAIRFEVDHRGQSDGQFILTGSAVPPQSDRMEHSGTGRIARLRMRTMSLFESGESSGEVSLEQLFAGESAVSGHNSYDLQRVAFLICSGGWPAGLHKSDRAALRIPFDYYDGLIHRDISRVDGVERNAEWADRMLRSYARVQGSQASINTILQDILSVSADAMSGKTVDNYLDAFRKLFVIEDVKAWSPNLRSKTAIRTTDTRYFVDPSIATAAMGIGPNDLTSDLQTMGFMFETLCMRDLRVYADLLDGNVYHYRDKDELECDAVLHLRNGRYALIEIKLGGDVAIEEAAKNLKRLSNKINTDTMREPSFCMVLTAVGQFAYRRTDGIVVVPIGCLRP